MSKEKFFVFHSDYYTIGMGETLDEAITNWEKGTKDSFEEYGTGLVIIKGEQVRVTKHITYSINTDPIEE